MTNRGLLEITLAVVMVLVGCASQPSGAVAPTRVATSTKSATVTPSAVTTDTLAAAVTSTGTPTGTPTVVATDTPPPAVTPSKVGTGTPLAVTPATSPCILSPVLVPTSPAEAPGYAQLDSDTGLHLTGHPQEIDLESYRLEVTGEVDHPLSLTYDDLRCLPTVEITTKLVCPGVFIDEATWAGVPIREVLELAGVQEEAAGLTLVGADGYARTVPMDEKLIETAFLAYEWEGEPLPILHGFPVRVVIPDYVGGAWVKWLIEIEVSETKSSIPWELR